MLKLSIKEIITLTYLTNYNLKIINDAIRDNISFEGIINNLVVKLKISNFDYTNSISLTESAMDKLKYYNIKSVSIFDSKYPSLLKNINDAPPIIYYKGELKDEKMVAVVGSRKTSQYALKITNKIVDWLSELNYGIVSGLALGIDTFAHEQSLSNNQYTIAVLPNSLDAIYPKSNFNLANRILDNGGLLISEMIFNINRGKKSFVQRNRIQSALSEAVIPIEMGLNSGTTHTINFAKKYDKKIVVMKPTPLLHNLESFKGINHLIKSSHKNLRVFSDAESFMSVFKNLDITNQLNLEL